jgi:hypothetical protein
MRTSRRMCLGQRGFPGALAGVAGCEDCGHKCDLAGVKSKPSFAIVATEDRMINPELERGTG